MSPEITKIIERYLQNELSEADHAAFEQKLTESDALLNEVILHRQLHEAAKRSAQRTLVQQTAKRYHFRKKLITTAVAVVVATAVTCAIVLVLKSGQETSEGPLSEQAMTSLLQELDAGAPLDNILPEYFNLASKDTVVLSANGVLLSVPEGAFLLNGAPYSGAKIIQWQEALAAADIVKSGLSTMSGDRLLETQGMFGLQAFTPEGKELTINPKVGVYVQVPVDELKTGMQLFEGKKGQNGVIDWQNPQPLEKLPVQADMKDLDFYPPGYEAELDALNWKTGKKDRDSLYLSFDQQDMTAQQETNSEMAAPVVDTFIQSTQVAEALRKYLGTTKIVMGTTYEMDVSCTMLSPNKARMQINGTIISGQKPKSTGPRNETMNLRSSSPDITIQHYGTEVRQSGTTNSITALYDIRLNKPGKIDAEGTIHFEYYVPGSNQPKVVDNYMTIGFTTGDSPEKPALEARMVIPPSRVLAFWQPKFNHTILATRDFEKRMRSVHGTCSEAVLNKYTNNLNKPLYEIDAELAAMGYPEFAEFAKERVGAVKLDNPHMNNLRQFYESSITKLKQAAKKDRNFIRNREKAWDRKMAASRKKESRRTAKREIRALNEEYELNLRNVCRQLGRTVGFQIHGGGTVYNIDKYVMDATVARKTTVISDPENGKTATITYNDFSATVANAGTYQKLLLYLFPHELNSFQRIDPKKDGVFEYPLNNDIVYDLVIVGINEGGYHIYEKTGLNKGALGTVTLRQVSEADFNQRIESLNKGRNDHRKQMKISDELEWLLKEQQNYKVQRLRQENAAFRNKISRVIFPCLREREYDVLVLAK